MNPNAGKIEKRRSFRCPVSGERQEGELRFGKKRLQVNLMDESSGGFCVLCEEPPNIEAGAVGLFFVNGYWYEVRVTRIQPVEATPAEEIPSGEDFVKSCREEFTTMFAEAAAAGPGGSIFEPELEEPPIGYRIGLCRLSDAYNPDVKPAFYSWAGLFCQLKQVDSNTWGVITAGVILALIVAIFPLTSLELITSDSANEHLQKNVRWLDSLDKKEKSRTNDNRSGSKAPSVFQSFAKSVEKTPPETPKTPNKPPAKESSFSSNLGDKIEELRQTIRSLPGAMPFTVPEVIKQLQLTESQQKRIRELIDAATDAIKNLGGFSSDGRAKVNDPAVKIIMETTRDNVIELLDADQKKKWSELTGKSDKK